MPNFLKLLVCEHLIIVNMSWEEVAKEMEGVEGVISMMDEENLEGEEVKDEEQDKENNKHDSDERNAGLQSLLLSEILQFRSSQLRKVHKEDGDPLPSRETQDQERRRKLEEASEKMEEKEEDGTLTDISLFTMDSGKEPKSGVQASIMPVLVSASPDFSRSGILRRENIHQMPKTTPVRSYRTDIRSLFSYV